jgi:hypothetical protein
VENETARSRTSSSAVTTRYPVCRFASHSADVVSPAGQIPREVPVPHLRDDDVVLDPNADAAKLLGKHEIVGLEVQAGLDREQVSGLQDPVEIPLGPGVAAIVDVEPAGRVVSVTPGAREERNST